jgi:hypothetical protein
LRAFLAFVAFCLPVAAQTVLYGNAKTQIYGDVLINPTTTTYTHVYVVFPPQSSIPNNAHFTSYVMTQPSIDGVTLEVPWNVVEINPPTQMDCTSSMLPDKCQPDPYAIGWFHTYDNWSAIDGSGCSDQSPNSSSQWFCQFGGVYKKVNFELFGIGDSPTNSITPAYVTENFWITAASPSYLYQDVVNTINASGCGGYSGTLSPTGALFQGNGAGYVNVSGWSSGQPTPTLGDTIWVGGFTGLAAALNVEGQYGAAVYTGSTCSGTSPTPNFCYALSGAGSASGTGTTSTNLVRAVDSWPVPYELPYKAAWEAFLTAAIYHFNHYTNVSQIAYIRPGVARGGEAIPLCTTVGPLYGMNPPSFPGTNPLYGQGTWEAWYAAVNSTVTAAQPQMQIMYSINSGDSQHPNANYATQEAMTAVSYSNATGLYNGFGSQGLQIADDTPFGTCPGGTGAPTTSNNWGCMFTQYWSGGSTSTTVPLELQQIDCSNPNGYAPTGTNKCLHGTSGTGITGNLGQVYPFATSNHASILELYNEDALLAFDPYYCVISGSTCAVTGSPTSDSFGTDLSLNAQINFFNAAGISSGCNTTYNVPAPISGTGGCAYAATISSAHGPH